MDKSTAINQMVIPSQNRPGKPRGGVIQIWLTRQCDKSCFNCTQGANLQNSNPVQISLGQFEIACKSLVDYFGIVGIFGGNPALHKQFPEICEILRSYIPKDRCGLWCNRIFKYGQIARETFNPAVSNLNVHGDETAYQEFRESWPEARPFGLDNDSRHSPVYISMQDLIEAEEERWDLISRCDINRHWSAMIGVFRGQLRGWFCEIAGAQAMLNQYDEAYPDTGLIIDESNLDWWKFPREKFEQQIEFHCHRCGVPLRGYGSLANNSDGQSIETTSKEYVELYIPKSKDRKVEVVTTTEQLKAQALPRMTNYLQNAR